MTWRKSVVEGMTFWRTARASICHNPGGLLGEYMLWVDRAFIGHFPSLSAAKAEAKVRA